MKATLLAVMLAVALQSGSGLTARSAVLLPLLPDTLLHNVDDDDVCSIEPIPPIGCKDGHCVCSRDNEGHQHCHWEWDCER